MLNFVIGEYAYALHTYLQKPFTGKNLTYPEKVFNYRLSRSRRVVERAFGIVQTQTTISYLDCEEVKGNYNIWRDELLANN